MLGPKIMELLQELADWLELEESSPVEWVVCGGAAMALQNLNPRATRDVDVLGLWNAALMEIVRVEEFPEKVKSCIRRVADGHPELEGLKENWVNLGPRRLAEFGLPNGFGQRLTTVKFGKTLTLHLLSRDDLLPLKLYAASDEFGPRQEIHFRDVKALKPTFDELDRAVDWMRLLPDFEKTRTELKNVLERLGFDDLAYYV
jgi:hypothetical protein